MSDPRVRWLILALVFVAAILNYVDRQIIAVLKPVLSSELGWTDREYAHLASAFQFGAIAAYFGVGWFIDRVGLRLGYPLAVGGWSLAVAAHATVQTLGQFTVVRVLLGVAEAVHTPAAVKAVATWFPRDTERSTAIGIMSSAANFGAIMTPLLVPTIAIAFGWRAAFVGAGVLGVAWVVCWAAVRTPPEIAARERAGAAHPRATRSWRIVLSQRAAWGIAGAKFLIDQVWWLLLFWVPDFFHRVYHLDVQAAGLPIAFIYAMAALGSVVGGTVPAALQSRGIALRRARKGLMFICALIIVPIPLVMGVEGYWTAAIVIGVAIAAHQGFSTSIFALIADVFPPHTVGTVVGLGALCGNIGGLVMLETTGWVLSTGGSYGPMFMFASVAYLAAWGLLHATVRDSPRRDDAWA
jgi:ACS family hexuronate transporter-like MFS transporter